MQAEHVQSGLQVSVILIPKKFVFQTMKKEDSLQRTLQVLGSQMHSNVLPVYDMVYDSENFYVIAAKIKGGTLKQLIEQRKMTYFSEKQVKYVAY